METWCKNILTLHDIAIFVLRLC